MITVGEQAEMALRVVREAPVIAYDTETSGLNWHVNSVVGYVITASKEANFYIPIRHGGGGNLLDPNGRVMPLINADDKTFTHPFEEALQKAFLDRRRAGHLTIGHNLNFDMHMSANHGVYLGRRCEDTSHNAAILDEYARSYSLTNVAKSMHVTAKLGEELYAHLASRFGGKPDSSAMGNFWRLGGTDPLAVDYATGDGITTLELAEAQGKEIEKEGPTYIHRLESDLIWTVFRIERRGIKADGAYIEDLIKAVDSEITTAEHKLPRGFNTRSPLDVRRYMESTGHLDWPMTAPSKNFPQGQPSFTEKWLKTHEEGRYVIAIRQLTNLKNTFIIPLKERHITDGVVHASLHQLKADDYGTVAGRFSCSNPNLQAIHKRNKTLGRRFRRIFVAREGMQFNERDYSQCEPRLFGHYSKDPALIDGYTQTPFRDVHQIVADAFGCERDPTAKRMNMGIFTGMQAESFAGHMGWDIDKATREWNRWFDLFQSIRQFQNDAKAVMKSRGFVRTILGRVCRMDNPRFAYRATSRIIQGSNADIVKFKMREIDRMLEDEGDIAWLLMTIHDSFEDETPLGSKGDEISAEITRMMEEVQCPPINLRIPFVVETGSGPSWDIATYGPLPPGT